MSEIIQFFRFIFWKIDDFIHSLWLNLTFRYLLKTMLQKSELGRVIHFFPKLARRKLFCLPHYLNFKINKSILNYRIDTTTWGWNHGSQSSKLVCFKFGLYFCWRSFLWHIHHKFPCNCQIYMVIYVKFLMGDTIVDGFWRKTFIF